MSETIQRMCPIGLDASPQFCSAGSCDVCVGMRIEMLTDELAAATKRAEEAEAKIVLDDGLERTLRGCRALIEKLRTRTAEMERALDQDDGLWFDRKKASAVIASAIVAATKRAEAAEQENARLREGKPHHVVDWPDSEGNWWNSYVSYPCRITRSGGEMLIGSEQIGDKWVDRREWESLVGKTLWIKMSEENPFATEGAK